MARRALAIIRRLFWRRRLAARGPVRPRETLLFCAVADGFIRVDAQGREEG